MECETIIATFLQVPFVVFYKGNNRKTVPSCSRAYYVLNWIDMQKICNNNTIDDCSSVCKLSLYLYVT